MVETEVKRPLPAVMYVPNKHQVDPDILALINTLRSKFNSLSKDQQSYLINTKMEGIWSKPRDEILRQLRDANEWLNNPSIPGQIQAIPTNTALPTSVRLPKIINDAAYYINLSKHPDKQNQASQDWLYDQIYKLIMKLNNLPTNDPVAQVWRTLKDTEPFKGYIKDHKIGVIQVHPYHSSNRIEGFFAESLNTTELSNLLRSYPEYGKVREKLFSIFGLQFMSLVERAAYDNVVNPLHILSIYCAENDAVLLDQSFDIGGMYSSASNVKNDIHYKDTTASRSSPPCVGIAQFNPETFTNTFAIILRSKKFKSSGPSLANSSTLRTNPFISIYAMAQLIHSDRIRSIRAGLPDDIVGIGNAYNSGDPRGQGYGPATQQIYDQFQHPNSEFYKHYKL